MAVGYKAAAAACDTTVLWLEMGMSFNKSCGLLVSSHNTPGSQKFVCWVTWEIWERPFPCAAEEAEAAAEEKQGQKGFTTTFESCDSEKEEFLSWKCQTKLQS